MFEFCIPTKSSNVPTGPDWLHEIKSDGYRLRQARRRRAAGFRLEQKVVAAMATDDLIVPAIPVAIPVDN